MNPQIIIIVVKVAGIAYKIFKIYKKVSSK